MQMTIRRLPRPRFAGFIVAIMFLALGGACGILDPEIGDSGTVRFMEIEGGCWTIQTATTEYAPLNLPFDFQIDGLEVDFEARSREGQASFCPGKIVELIWIDFSEGGS